MKVKTSELSGATLDWAVGVASGKPVLKLGRKSGKTCVYISLPTISGVMLDRPFQPSTDPSQALEIIDREDIATSPRPDGLWKAYIPNGTRWVHKGDESVEVFNWHYKAEGYSLLIAAMRCYVMSKLGEEVEIPDELMI